MTDPTEIATDFDNIGIYTTASPSLGSRAYPFVATDGQKSLFQIEVSPAHKAEFFVPVIFHDAVMLEQAPTSIVYVEPAAMAFHCALLVIGALIGALLVSRLRRHTSIDGRGAWGSR